MADRNKALWWFAMTALLISVVTIWLVFKGHPVPGDIIIVRPEPNDPNNASSAHWTIGGSDPTARYEPENVKFLNKNAFRSIKQYYARAWLDQNSPVLMINTPAQLMASFGHCSDLSAGVLHPCVSDADCPVSGPTCVVSTMRLTVESGTPQKFHWYLKVTPNSQEMELVPHDYGDPKEWRAELCGRLIGDITVTHKNTPYVVPSGKFAWIWAEWP